MESHDPVTVPFEPQAATADPAMDEASQPYVGRWNTLVSTTNWEKGRIIYEWRAALLGAGAPSREYADEAWARRVGAVTGQHVGRLRRVYERFGDSANEYPRLYWSHFHSALDWDDAEMWLEGALQSGWSVSQMRRQRWEAMGAVEADRPREADVVAADVDEDVRAGAREDREPDAGPFSETLGPPIPEGPDFGDEADLSTSPAGDAAEPLPANAAEGEAVERVRPFQDLGELPEDVSEAFESFKIAILRHKSQNWDEISRDDLLAALDALKALASAPSAD
jgi:hypothetical protein